MNVEVVEGQAIALADADKQATTEELFARFGQPDIAVIDPPFDASGSWTSHVMDPCIVFGQMRHMLELDPALFRFERVIAKRRGHRSATVQIRHEHAFVAQVGSNKVLPRSRDTFPSVVWQGVGESGDPHEKSLALVMEHLTIWSPPWSVVWDPYAGSGTVAEAPRRLGRRSICCELDPDKCAIIKARLRQQWLDLETSA